MASARQDVSIYRGEDRTITVTVKDDEGVVVDLSGWSLHLTIRRSVDDVDPCVTKKITELAVAGVGVIRPQTGDDVGIGDFLIVPADTLPLEGRYIYDVWGITDTGTKHVIIPPSVWDVLESASGPAELV